MVSLVLAWTLGLADADRAVPRALAKGNYPWYDASHDTVRPIWSSATDWSRDQNTSSGASSWSFAGVGEIVGYTLAMLALAVLVLALIELWRRYHPEASATVGNVLGPGGASRIEGLPAGVRAETLDPWNEAIEHRARGDYARAVVCLFAHQLVALERRRQIRLVPGRTARQLIRAVDDPRFRNWVEPTMRLFEAVYYGHRTPSAFEFERVWALALEMEQTLDTEVVS